MGAFKSICDSVITDKEFATLLTGEPIQKNIKKGSKTWLQELIYNKTEHKIEFVTHEDTPSAYSCPKCQKPLIDAGRLFKCEESCGFTFWKTACGKVLSDAQIAKFFQTGSTGTVKGLKSKTGKTFSAAIVLNEEKTGTSFQFD